jgi:exo-1,4-beta-D-glucosaminidase
MKSILRFIPHLTTAIGIAAIATGFAMPADAVSRHMLADGWMTQSSARIQGGGEAISAAGFGTSGWYRATVPSTVVGTLVQNKIYPDPFFGMNFRSLPGASYPVGSNFSNIAMPADSPFKVSWWYRKEFQVVKGTGQQVWLHFDGINFRANIWINGKRIADSKKVAGAYRLFEFNITDAVADAKTNVLALEIFPPDVNDLAITWVDWNPMPPDKNMGIWRDAYITMTGPVALRYPQIVTKVDLPALNSARLTISAELQNVESRPVKATLKGTIEKIAFQQTIELAAKETRQVTFAPDKYPQLAIAQPRLWWPIHMGPQNLYDLSLQVESDGKLSDSETIRFGIREAASEFNSKGYRVFKISGKPILIRGGGWAPDVFLRPSREREIEEIRYVKDMNLNAIRFEAKMESRRFLELCDREGILVMPGWCCCDHWEKGDQWDEEDYSISAESLRDQSRRLRNHPSVFVWLNGSDNPPNERAEKKYLEVLKETNWPNPVLSSATEQPTKVSGNTGVRMTGPYEYVPPIYWYVDAKRGGAYSFNTETGPGPAIPPIESLRKFLPREHLWPIDEFWYFHAGGEQFKDIKVFTTALNTRMGEAKSVEDYTRKAQVMAYDGERAMFEAYARNKYTSTGVIQWMMNNAWPSLIWHLYDYYLRPAGGYFGTKKACEPLHIQYSYDDRSVVVVSSYNRDIWKLKATARILNLDMTEKFIRTAEVDATPDCSKRIFTLPEPPDLTPTYFVKLTLEEASGKPVSSNFYWLSTKPETLEDSKGTWYYTPTKTYADFTALTTLPAVSLNISAKTERRGRDEVAHVTFANPSPNLAFFVHLKINKGKGGEEVLPILWQDNYIPVLPGEKREISATFGWEGLQGSGLYLSVDGYNVPAMELPIAK